MPSVAKWNLISRSVFFVQWTQDHIKPQTFSWHSAFPHKVNKLSSETCPQFKMESMVVFPPPFLSVNIYFLTEMNKDWKENCLPGLEKRCIIIKAWQIFD